MKTPKFSIIIPAHNSALFIRKALDSVRIQTFKDYELIVVCDACDDDTESIAREYTDKVIPVNFHNEGRTRNVGLDNATGEWVLWIDDDDWWMHEYVLAQLNSALTDEMDVLCFSFIFKHRGYASPRGNNGDRWIAVWTKCWRRSFIGSTRFEVEFPCDVGWYTKMMLKRPRIADFDRLMYYYNYLREGSASYQVEVEGKRLPD